MAKNTGEDYRTGSEKERSQLNLDTEKGKFVKRNLASGEFIDLKEDNRPFKGVAKEPDKRRTSSSGKK